GRRERRIAVRCEVAVRSIAATLFAALALPAIPASAQTVSVEAAQTIGQTTDGPAVAATQLRLFGEALSATRFIVEGAWGTRSDEATETDAFGSAYPYDNEIELIEAYGERTFRPRGAL